MDHSTKVKIVFEALFLGLEVNFNGKRYAFDEDNSLTFYNSTARRWCSSYLTVWEFLEAIKALTDCEVRQLMLDSATANAV